MGLIISTTDGGAIGWIEGVDPLIVDVVNFSSSDSAATTRFVPNVDRRFDRRRQKIIIIAPKSDAVIKIPKSIPNMSP